MEGMMTGDTFDLTGKIAVVTGASRGIGASWVNIECRLTDVRPQGILLPGTRRYGASIDDLHDQIKEGSATGGDL
jgi:NADP-dependent 3-hydroxy acid dehydrogenase YdfG